MLIALGLVATFGILAVIAISMGYGTNTYLFQDGSTPLTANWDINGNYILEFPLESSLHLDLQQGVTDIHISSIPAGFHTQDKRILALHVSVDTPVGDGKSLVVTISDGTDSLEVTISGDVEESDYDDSTPFNLDVSAEDFSIQYSQTAGGSATSACVMYHWYYKINE